MESKLCQQKSATTYLVKPKQKISLSEKQNTWSNLLNKKSTSTNIVTEPKNKSRKHSSIYNKNNKSMKVNILMKIIYLLDNCLFLSAISKGVQCNSVTSNYNAKLCQSSDQLSVFNPIRTLQFLLKEIKGLNIQGK